MSDQTIEELAKHERHNTNAETRYWCEQYKQKAIALSAQVRELREENERLIKELNIRKGDPVTRLHNICSGLEEMGKESPFTREEWERIDAENVALIAQLHELQKASEIWESRANDRHAQILRLEQSLSTARESIANKLGSLPAS